MYIVTMSGKLKQSSGQQNSPCQYNGERDISLFSFSKTGELLYKFQIPGWDYHKLTSHPNGPIYFVALKK